VKEELLPLVKLKGIGRVACRMLYNAGLKSLQDLRECLSAACRRYWAAP